jgi:hypothetical protein
MHGISKLAGPAGIRKDLGGIASFETIFTD